ncbi:MAG: Stk1 family PASTA domain-containing Ser/Thr kinase [Bacillota bacterium]|nr:Stk1 family PASTA domain-containing Ser/Thr kinase [Bacillota bacterium]
MANENERTISTGMILGSRYRIMRMIGSGGMALVYLAVDTQTGREVAIKILKSELANDEEFVRRFDTEAKAASSLSHPNIVRVLGVGEERRIRYMVQEYVEGTTLKELIDQYSRLDWRVAVPIALQVALALEHAHAAGIVHRDIKPHNIMITPDRQALVTDFGIARASSANTITFASGTAMGSVHYFSPEQARGGMVGPSADIYSLGILIYEMLTGDVPFDGETSVAVAIRHLQDTPTNPREIVPELPIGLCDIVMKCIRKTPRQRYANARELIDDLDAFVLDPSGRYGYVDDTLDSQTLSVEGPSLAPDADYERIHELERSIQQRRRSRQRENGLLIVFILLFTAMLIALTMFIWSRLSPPAHVEETQGREYVVENFIGKTRDEAEHLIAAAGLPPPDIREEARSDTPMNQVYDQDPPEGEVISLSGIRRLILYVSTGDSSLRLANYAGQNVRTAEADIRYRYDSQYEVRVVMEANDETPQNVVIRHDPPAGEIPADGIVILYVSEGPPDVAIPLDLNGRSRSDVEYILEEMGLIIAQTAVISPDPSLPPESQFLVAIEPMPGTVVRRGSRVTLSFADYNWLHPTPVPTTTPEPTTVPTTTPEPTTLPTTEETTTLPPTTQPTDPPTTVASTTPPPEPPPTEPPEPPPETTAAP